MKTHKILFMFLALGYISIFQAQNHKLPKLVVGIVVDQMRYDYIYKYWDSFSDNGFKKLVNDGFFCRNTVYDYFPTYTGPGHASIYSGTTPSVHGIIGNNWYNYKTKQPVYCAGDGKSQTICFCKKPHFKADADAGKKSPSLLLSTTIGDELKLKDSLSRVFSLSLKDRSAVLSGGHMADGAFWINSKAEWITCDYYCDTMPSWISDFHKIHPISDYLKGYWNSMNTSVDLVKMLKSYGPSYITSTPKGNDLIVDFTKVIIEQEDLGLDNHTDLLSISFSSTDYIGHKYGPDSPQIRSAFQFLDQNIADLLQFLENKIGKENLLIFLTSDHGVASVPTTLKKFNVPAGNADVMSMKNQLDSLLEDEFGQKGVIWKYSNMQFYLDFDLIDSLKLSLLKVKKSLLNNIKKFEFVDQVYDFENITTSQLVDERTKTLLKGIYPNRSGQIGFTFKPGWIERVSLKGTGHGTHYRYDTHVPLIFYGNNIPPTLCDRLVSISDVAPTLSLFMHTSFPSGSTGAPIFELTEKQH
jgi:hypothetical protein